MRVLILATLLLIAACGQKGQLYLPVPAQTGMSVPAGEDPGALPPDAIFESEGEVEAEVETGELEVEKDKND